MTVVMRVTVMVDYWGKTKVEQKDSSMAVGMVQLMADWMAEIKVDYSDMLMAVH